MTTNRGREPDFPLAESRTVSTTASESPSSPATILLSAPGVAPSGSPVLREARKPAPMARHSSSSARLKAERSSARVAGSVPSARRPDVTRRLARPKSDAASAPLCCRPPVSQAVSSSVPGRVGRRTGGPWPGFRSPSCRTNAACDSDSGRGRASRSRPSRNGVAARDPLARRGGRPPIAPPARGPARVAGRSPTIGERNGTGQATEGCPYGAEEAAPRGTPPERSAREARAPHPPGLASRSARARRAGRLLQRSQAFRDNSPSVRATRPT